MSSTQTNSIEQPQQTPRQKIKKVKKLVLKKDNAAPKEENKENQEKHIVNAFHDTLMNEILSWLGQNEIGKTDKKRRSIAQDMCWCVWNNNLTVRDIELIREYINEHKFATERFQGNLWDSITDYFGHDKYDGFWKSEFELRPRGLDTSPTACCGKAELLYRLLRPGSRQPNKGDIMDEGKKDIKGNEIRLFHEDMTGKQYKEMTDKLFGPTTLQPNKITSGTLKGKDAYEIEKKGHEAHWKTEFSKLTNEEGIDLIHQYFNSLSVEGDTRVKAENVFKNNEYDRGLLVKTILEDFMKNVDCEWIVFGDGTNVKRLKTIDDLSQFTMKSDYFRINQCGKLGWYVE